MLSSVITEEDFCVFLHDFLHVCSRKMRVNKPKNYSISEKLPNQHVDA